jgi:hypothetical protein
MTLKRLFHIVGHAACFIALFAMLNGHWLVLQSVAWTRMLVKFSEQDSLATALFKTFDGKHPCRMCLQIRQGRQQRERQHQGVPLITPGKMPDLILDDRQALPPFTPPEAREAVPFAPGLHPDFVVSPPTPPPRGSLADL